MEKYYLITKNGKIVGILKEKDLDKIAEKDKFFDLDIKVTEISKNAALKLSKEQKIPMVSSKKIKESKEHLFVLEIVAKIKEQLMLQKDMDLILPEKARAFLPEIQKELRNQGITLKNPIRECIDDIDALSKFEDKLKREKDRSKGYGRSLGEE